MTLFFYYLAPLQNDTVVTSQCMQFTFGDKGEATFLIRVSYLWLKERGRESYFSTWFDVEKQYKNGGKGQVFFSGVSFI